MAERPALVGSAGGCDAVTRTPQLMALSSSLADAGHEVTVYGRAGSTAPGSRVVGIDGHSDDDVFHVLVAAWTEERPDVVHAHDGGLSLVAGVAAKHLGIRFVHSLHTEETAGARLADRIIVPSTARRSQLIAEGVPRGRVDVVPYGVDVVHLTPDGPAAPKRLRHRVVAIGELGPQSGFAATIAALPALPDAELVIVGGPTDGTYAGQMRQYATDLGVADRLVLAGPVTRRDLPGLLRSADVVVCRPRHEGFDLTAVEAMACGAAVVADDAGGLADTVIHGVTGVLVPPRHRSALTAALRRLLLRPVIREQYGATGRDRAFVRYSRARIAAETLQAYRRAGVVDPAEAATTPRSRDGADPAPAAQPQPAVGG